MSDPTPLIGIVGGVGPYAGLDLAAKVFDQTAARRDQEHLPVALLSLPHTIADRTAYLLGDVTENPAYALAEVIRRLETLGATVVGIPCNTAHAPRIFDVLLAELARTGNRLRVLHMIHETARFLAETLPGVQRVGVLSTTGTARAAVYPEVLAPLGIRPRRRMTGKRASQAAIYDETYGIKAQSAGHRMRPRRSCSPRPGTCMLRAPKPLSWATLRFPLPCRSAPSTACPPLIRPWCWPALIRETYPDKLKPLA